MTRLFQLILGAKSSQPIKRVANVVVSPDAETGDVDAQPVHDELYSLSPDGSIDKVVIEHRGVYHCGCDLRRPFGGRCSECGHHSCTECFGRCGRCSKPLCLEHSRFVEMASGPRQRLCGRCADVSQRREIRRRVTRRLLSPFIVFDERIGERRC